jgi:ClpP class serine protease
MKTDTTSCSSDDDQAIEAKLVEELVKINDRAAAREANKTADRKAYMRKYYHEKQKEEVQCEFCDRTFSCKSSMVNHMRTSQKCSLKQALVALDELNKHAENLRKFVGTQ